MSILIVGFLIFSRCAFGPHLCRRMAQDADCAHGREGTRLADDLLTRRGVLLISRDSIINAHQVEQLRGFETHEEVPFAIVVYHDS